MKRLLPIIISVAACVASLAALPQEPSQPVPLFRSRVDLVVLDVSVLDSERRPVRGLTAQDFSIVENGQPQTIAMFSAIDIPDAPPPTAPWLREVAPDVRRNEDDARGQLVVLLLDDANPMSASDLSQARRYARSVIDRLGPNDLAAVAYVANARNGQEFTRDRARLLAAVDRFGGPGEITIGPPGALAMLGPRYTLSSLIGQAEAMADLSTRRKVVIFISARGAAVPASVASEAQAAAEGQDAPGAVEAPGMLAGMKADTLGEFGRFVRAAQQANVAVYCVDPGGLRAPETRSNPIGRATSTYIHNPNAIGVASLRALSVNTGAFAIVETNDPEPGLTQAFRENRSYYLLAYASTDNRADGRFRQISVRVARPGVTVRTRSGYFGPTAKEAGRVPTQPTTASAALARAIAKPDIPLEVAAAPFGIANRPEAAVAVVVRVRQPAAAAVKGLVVDVRAVDYLAKERASERVPVTIGVRPDAEFDVEYDVLARLELAAGRYQLRVAAAERAGSGAPAATAGRVGSVFCDLDVPDFLRAPLSLSGLVVSRASGSLVAPKDRLAATIPVIPTTVRTFRPTDGALVFLRVYQGGLGPLAPVRVRVRVTDARDRTVHNSSGTLDPERFTQGRSADIQREIPLDQLEGGEYLLTVDAQAGDAVCRRDVRFTVVTEPTAADTAAFRSGPYGRVAPR